MAGSDLAVGRTETSGARSAGLTDTNTENDLLPTTEEQIESKDETLNLREWIVQRFNWTWFTCSQSTGGIAILLSESPKQFYGLQTIATVVFIFNLVLFSVFTALLVVRWVSQPSAIRNCFVQAPECFFFGSFWLTIATVIISMEQFGAPHAGAWLTVAIRLCYWIYAAVTLVSATAHFVTIFELTPVTAVQMNPGSMILVYNTMLTGTIAAAIAKGQPPAQRLPIIVSGIAFQGFGWITSLILLVWFFGNLMQNGWPPPDKAPGLFITVGSVGFTIVALIGNAQALPDGYAYFESHPMAAEVLLIVATWVGIFSWLFMLWLFGLALFVTVAQFVRVRRGTVKTPMRFNNSWWGEYTACTNRGNLPAADSFAPSVDLPQRRLYPGHSLYWTAAAEQCDTVGVDDNDYPSGSGLADSAV